MIHANTPDALVNMMMYSIPIFSFFFFLKSWENASFEKYKRDI